jgi:TolB-like protein/DNA-binding winged helix-turn-helix (wHTH) protein/Tfp pilus assembly protein PilF
MAARMTPDQLPPNAAPVELAVAGDFTLGRLDVRPSVREAVRDGQRHHVEPRVMQVLVALARARGAVLSRDDLMRSCWNSRVVGEAAIHRCIFKLRELADAGEGRTDFLIETIPRVGYRLEAAACPAVPIDETALPREVVAKPRKVRASILAAACLALSVAAFFGWRTLVEAPQSRAASAASIAVMPFKNLSAEPGAAYLADGMQNEVLTRLTGIGALRVISRTSSDRMAERPGSLADVAHQLGVGLVVEGSVQRVGNALRVDARLIRVDGDDHVWAERYERALDDERSAENGIADAIATAVASRVAPGESEPQPTALPADRRAYELYLRALVLFRKDRVDDYKLAAGALREAVAIDPSFATAWALLSRADAKLFFSGAGGDVQRSESRSALDKAKAIAPARLEVRLADGFYKYHVERDYPAAARALEAIMTTWPNNAEVLQSFGFVTRRVGRWDDSIRALREVVRLDPLVPGNYSRLAETLAMHREPGETLKTLDAGLALWPEDTDLLTHKICVLQSSGQLDRAAFELARLPPAQLDEFVLGVRGNQYAQTRQFAEGLRYFETVRTRAEVATWDPELTAIFDIDIGDFRRWTGDENGARTEYEAALQALHAPIANDPDDPELLSLVSIAYSALGDRTSALRHADRASQWYSHTNDPVGASEYEFYRATALARLGDADAAIPLLARLLDTPGGPTVDHLRLDPAFDRLRDDARFARLIARSDAM